MTRKVQEIFTCEHCGKEWQTEPEYDKCVLSHDIVYIGLERQEWKSLLKSILEANYAGLKFDETVVTKLLKYKLGIKRGIR